MNTLDLVEEANSLRAENVRLKNDLAVAQMHAAATRSEERRQIRVNETARALFGCGWARSPQTAYEAADALEWVREQYVAKRAAEQKRGA